MSADKDRGIRRQKQKRAKQLKKEDGKLREAAAGVKATSKDAGANKAAS